MSKDLWHYRRKELAKQILGMFETGISNALIFFAPRRMGKTEFLVKDITPLAEEKKWHVFYFSFLDQGDQPEQEFNLALRKFAAQLNNNSKSSDVFKKIKKISGGLTGVNAEIEFNSFDQNADNLHEIFSDLNKQGNILLLLDEVQILAKQNKNNKLIASLRTNLDLNKDSIKVIFTGSSREGLRKMFSQATAPFFHFGQNLLFPDLERDFTDHLANVFFQVTTRQLDEDELWQAFIDLKKVPQLARSLVERLALDPTLSINKAKKSLLEDLIDDRSYTETWDKCSALEKLLLLEIAVKATNLFSQEKRSELASKLGIKDVSVSNLQSALRTLLRKDLIGKLDQYGGYYIDDPNFSSWVLQR